MGAGKKLHSKDLGFSWKVHILMNYLEFEVVVDQNRFLVALNMVDGNTESRTADIRYTNNANIVFYFTSWNSYKVNLDT